MDCGPGKPMLIQLDPTYPGVIVAVGLSQLFKNNFGNNRYLLEYENYSSLIGPQTSQDH